MKKRKSKSINCKSIKFRTNFFKNIRVKGFLGRIKNPMVITSIVSQVLIILTIFKVNVDIDMVTKVIVAFCSIMVSLGIMNNPSKEQIKKTIRIKCSKCGQVSEYIMIEGEVMCDKDGTPYEITLGGRGITKKQRFFK